MMEDFNAQAASREGSIQSRADCVVRGMMLRYVVNG